MRLMHPRVSRGRRRKIDSLAAPIAVAEACLLLVPAVGIAGVVGIGAEVALGIYGAGVVDERTVGSGQADRAGSFVGTGEPPLAGDGDCTNSVGVEGSGAVVTILSDAVTEGDAGADFVVVVGRANCSTEASISGGLSECTSTAPDITGIGSVAAEAVNDDSPRAVFLILADLAEPLDEGTVRFVSIEPPVDEAVFVIVVVFVMVLLTDDPPLFCLGGVVASGVGGCVR